MFALSGPEFKVRLRCLSYSASAIPFVSAADLLRIQIPLTITSHPAGCAESSPQILASLPPIPNPSILLLLSQIRLPNPSQSKFAVCSPIKIGQ